MTYIIYVPSWFSESQQKRPSNWREINFWLFPTTTMVAKQQHYGSNPVTKLQTATGLEECMKKPQNDYEI